MRSILILFLITIFSVTIFAAQSPTDTLTCDVVVYGGTSSGIIAAIQAKHMGKSVVIIAQGSRIGGLTTGGLGQTDIGNKAAIGGLARDFYRRIRVYYDDDANWKWQRRQEYRDSGQTRTAQDESCMWTFEPSAALQVFQDMITENDIHIIYNQRLNRETGVEKHKKRIVSITMESGLILYGKMFIDATYEGDLMAAAGVSYTVGREANSQYHETLNGVQAEGNGISLEGKKLQNFAYHDFVEGVDPYIIQGDPQSGLLPFIDPRGPGKAGQGDKRVQAYCFRMCLTDHPENRIPIVKPAVYNELDYELLLRNFEAGEMETPWINSSMPNRKTDTNNRLGFSIDFIGQNYDYAGASYTEREQIVIRHRLYQQGLMWTLANHPRVPENVRNEVSRWGTCKDEFVGADGWQDQLYIREARRMTGALVMTQHHCEGVQVVDDGIGLAAYGMDSHNVQRYVDENGTVKNEGDVEVGVRSPYPISYRAIIPQAKECTNLLVPVCLSATHIAYGSIRMEPVFMVLGQSAATAACLAIDDNVTVQKLDYKKLRQKLLLDNQYLVWENK
ncbi:MAG TPA: FAD-dependent oxidoreductase [bacterium]|nr:FAD-dependent oxidoreductase [bacterium]HPN45892.1 FAD-dependent oxidoreductase [bacterium]